MENFKPQAIAKVFGGIKSEIRNCKKHGDYESKLMKIPGSGSEIWSPCKACCREEIAREDQAMREQAIKDQAAARARAAIGRTAIPKRFESRTLESYEAKNEGQQKALNSATRYAQNWQENFANGTSLIFTGNPGTGKTHLAVGLALKVIEQGGDALYTRVIELARAVKETYGSKGRTEKQVINDFAKPDLLVIDEVGRQFGSDTEKMVMFEVINARYEQCKPTIIIANLQASQLESYIDPAALDRLREGGGRMVVFDWASQRGSM